MTDTPASAPPGWYTDPAGSVGERWWTGRDWTERMRFPNVAQRGIVQPPLPPGTSTGTVPIWIVALLPIVSAISDLFVDADRHLTTSFGSLSTRLSEAGSASTTVDVPSFDAATIVSDAVALVLAAAVVLLAVWDWRILRRRGIARPFHWAWSFLNPVYTIGRAVVVRRRTGKGLAPLWTYLAVLVVTETVAIIQVVVALQ